MKPSPTARNIHRYQIGDNAVLLLSEYDETLLTGFEAALFTKSGADEPQDENRDNEPGARSVLSDKFQVPPDGVSHPNLDNFPDDDLDPGPGDAVEWIAGGRLPFDEPPAGEARVLGRVAGLICVDYADSDAAAAARELDEGGRDWFLVRPFGRRPLLGPLFGPGRALCYECVRARLLENRPLAVQIWGPLDPPERPIPFDPSTTQEALRLARAWISRALAAERPDLEREVWLFDSERRTFERHAVWPREDCPRCPPPRPGSAIGRRLRRTVSRLTGVSTPPETLSPAWAPGFHAAAAHTVLPLGRQRRRWPPLPRRRVFGRGLSQEEARHGCSAEAVERYSATFHGSESFVTASATELGDRAILPARLTPWSERQNRRPSGGEGAAPLVPDAAVAWTRVQRLTDGAERFIPAASAYLDYADAGGPPGYADADTNGCAAGESFDDAALRALLELIERDAMALWWLNRATRPAAPGRAPDEISLEPTAGRRLDFLDLTTDLGVPVVAAVLTRAERAGVLVGLGCALDPAAARRGATLEALQIATLTEGLPPEEVIGFSSEPWAHYVDVAAYPYLGPDPTARAAPAADFPASASAAERLRALAERLAVRGIPAYALDLTRPQLGVPVVRAVAPGLRPFVRALGPGRLYTAPLRLGWLKESRSEDDMNPSAYPF